MHNEKFPRNNKKYIQEEKSMLKKIKVKDIATFDETGIEMDVRKINYIFGSNGTGKTTLSELLRKQDDFPTCRIEWEGNKSNYDVFVYNRNFVRENFSIRNNIKGIFTLGKESTDLLKKIDDKSEEATKYEDKIDKLDGNIKNIKENLNSMKDEFVTKCWDLKQRYDEHFKEAFTGVRNNKEKFMQKCIDEAESNNVLYSFEELMKRVGSVFQGTQEKINKINNVSYNTSIEKNPIFETKIIGKDSIDIAALISRLNISDWVQQGHQHLIDTDGFCPFCQQKLPHDFTEKIEEYFDEKYTKQVDNLNSSIEKYITETKDLINSLTATTDRNNPFINIDKINNIFETIESTYKENVQKLERKKVEPSRSVLDLSQYLGQK